MPHHLFYRRYLNQDPESGGGGQPQNLTLKTDIFGVEIELPIETAKALIAKRDERTKAFRDLDGKVKEFESKISDTQRQAEAQKAALEGKLAEAEALFTQKHAEKISKMQQAVAKAGVIAAVRANPEFIGDDAALNDAVALILASTSVDVTDDLSIKSSDGKALDDVVKAFLAARPAFRKAAPSVRGAPGKPTTTTTPTNMAKPNALSSIAAGLAKRSGN
jgi:hypothetical protein